MCTAIYIASDQPLPLVEWDEASPAFYVTELDEDALIVRQYFTGENVYYVGSYQGCGCGLAYQPYPGGDEEEADRTRRDWDHFAHYLEDLLQRVPTVELFTCWEGDQHEPPTTRVVINPVDIREGRFGYDEGTHAEIRPRTS